MGEYTQLTQEKRYQISAFLEAGFSQAGIAQEIGVDKSTISRELRRNRGRRGYRPKQAHAMAMDRRKGASKRIKMSPEVIAIVNDLIRKDFSPEQISGHMKKVRSFKLSHEAIYQHILKDKEAGGYLYKHLRRSQKKKRKRYGKNDRRGQIPGRISIDERPAIVDEKIRIGDWEIDTIIGKNHKGALLTIVERKSKFTLVKKLQGKKAAYVIDAAVSLLSPIQDNVHTITADNGKEFASHKMISQELSTQVYFAHPYHSWERGLCENTNGLIRQYFPKSTDFETITDDQVLMVMNRLNNRPRKSLGFATPHEVFYDSINTNAP